MIPGCKMSEKEINIRKLGLLLDVKMNLVENKLLA